jgi:type II secretory pathway component PulK
MTQNRRTLSTPRSRRGSIMAVVLLVIFGIAGTVLVLCRSARVEALVSANHVAAVQANSAERGAEQYVIALLAQQRDAVMTLQENYFHAVQVGQEGYFWIILPNYGDASLPTYGLVDEASKLNLNTASPDVLINLPNMPPELAYSITDWRDGDEEVLEDGAEDSYYMALAVPYHCKNAPFETVEELLLVRGAYPELLYGYAGAQQTRQTTRGGARLGTQSALGLADFLTVYSGRTNAAAEAAGAAAPTVVNINDRNQRQQLRQLLIQVFGQQRGGEISGQIRGRDQYTDIFDFYFKLRLTPDEFQAIAGQLGTSSNPSQRGRINLNTAPREVLLCLPNLDETDVSKILGMRTGTTLAFESIAAVAEALGEKAVGLGNFITTTSNQYSADIVAASLDGRAFRRVRVVVDISSANAPPRIVYRRDLTDRGWPLDPQTLVNLREGRGPGTVSGLGGMR